MLCEIKRFYVQNGKMIPNSESTIPGNPGNSITPGLLQGPEDGVRRRRPLQRQWWLAQILKGVAAPMVLVMSAVG